MRALEHITVLDLTHMLSGPYCTMLLADMGARTIKIEPPGRGEGTRRLLETSEDYARAGQGAYFLTLCRNKESVAIDLKSKAGLAVFHRLVAQADVVVSNFTAGVTEKLGLTYDTLKRHNPAVVTCALTGFGGAGPKRDWPAFDLVAQGMGGGMSLTGLPGGGPLRAGIPIGDLGGGLFAAIGILSALEARHQTGRGQHVDISMLDCQLSLLNYIATMTLMSGKPPGREGNGHFVHVPYNTFRTKTNHIILAIITDDIWVRLARVLGDEALSDEKFRGQKERLAHKEFIEERVEAILMTRTCEDWLDLLTAEKIPAAPVNEITQAFDDPQTRAREMKVDVPLHDGQSVAQPGNPVKLSETFENTYTAPPVLGSDTESVLKSIGGLSDQEIAELVAAGAVGGPAKT